MTNPLKEETNAQIEDLSAKRRALIEGLFANPRGLSWCEEHTALVDEVVRALVLDLGEVSAAVAVIAVGGYGRREMAPYSDIDITIVPASDGSPEIDDAVRRFFQGLNHAFGTILRMEIGYAYRLVADAAGLDAKTRTGLLDARLVSGSPAVFRSLQDALDDTFAPGDFILEKIEERRRMFAKFHDTPLVVEPELKEGAGGLRCFHCANWLRTAIGEREARPHRSYDAIVRARNLVHAVAGKHANLLSRPRQQKLSEVLGVDPFELMSEHAAHALNVHRHFTRAVEKLHEARFKLSGGCLAMLGEARILAGADAGDAAMGISIATRLGFRVPDISAGPTSRANGGAAATALSTGEETIRNADRAGLLAELLPELTACRTLIPNDTVHAYTVFEHTLRVVRAIETLAPDSFFGQLRDSLHDQEAIYLAALIHDVGKRISDSEHAAIGARVAREVGERWGLSPRVTETVAWLIEHHLDTAHVLRFRDLAEPSTAHEFAELVGDQDRLNMLALLAYADISAVAPDIWTSAQDASLRELHARTSDVIGEPEGRPQPAAHRARLVRQLASEQVSEQDVQGFVSSLPVHYLNSTPFELVRVHMSMVSKARQGEVIVEVQHRPDISGSDFTICCKDAPALLSHILGTFYALDLRVEGIRACTTTSTDKIQNPQSEIRNPDVALDVFTVNFNGRPVPSAMTAETLSALREVLAGTRDVESLVRDRGKDPDREQRVLSYRYVEGLPGILEIRAPRGRGLPYRLSRWIAAHGWNIQSARLGQWADNASAALYVTSQDGAALTKLDVESAMSERGL